jgi:hypothetical protein
MSKPSTQKVKNFRRKIFDLTEQELEIRAQMKRLYDQFCLDAQDDELALRHVRQAYYQIQKYRIQKRLSEIMEFHPFFGANPLSGAFGDDEEEEDGIF